MSSLLSWWYRVDEWPVLGIGSACSPLSLLQLRFGVPCSFPPKV
ncbi:hypothetical protein [Methanospirillum stamsii]|nr:hypothetical protein [Methanospirillum stamsii]